MRNFEALLLDMDGTLVDSEKYHTLAWTRLVEESGHRPAPDWLDKFVGEPDAKTEQCIFEIFPDLAGEGGLLARKQVIFRRLIAENAGDTPSKLD